MQQFALVQTIAFIIDFDQPARDLLGASELTRNVLGYPIQMVGQELRNLSGTYSTTLSMQLAPVVMLSC